ncbi:14667_t:CDS:2 [Gigaspora margarita]|uniref:14667_t:CDS:1 n=1 Tax=Gigaspora margarita TaxID=4874 RepID=A0ABN7VKQ7_GIGMA|nr:14667_t:CDS:2 [Gigaspora margarita]
MKITEINMIERKRKFLVYSINRKYTGYWLSAAKKKKKGSDAVKRVSEVIIEVMLFLKQIELVVIEAYMLPNVKTIEKKLQQRIVELPPKRKEKYKQSS